MIIKRKVHWKVYRILKTQYNKIEIILQTAKTNQSQLSACFDKLKFWKIDTYNLLKKYIEGNELESFKNYALYFYANTYEDLSAKTSALIGYLKSIGNEINFYDLENYSKKVMIYDWFYYHFGKITINMLISIISAIFKFTCKS